jgi:hypothetical protein
MMTMELIIFAGALAVICIFAALKIASDIVEIIVERKRQKRLERAYDDAIEAMRAKDI